MWTSQVIMAFLNLPLLAIVLAPVPVLLATMPGRRDHRPQATAGNNKAPWDHHQRCTESAPSQGRHPCFPAALRLECMAVLPRLHLLAHRPTLTLGLLHLCTSHATCVNALTIVRHPPWGIKVPLPEAMPKKSISYMTMTSIIRQRACPPV
jgi:hypothetical protein